MSNNNFQDIRKDINKKKEELERRKLSKPPLPPVNTTGEVEEKEEDRTLEWNLLLALFNGSEKRAYEIINTPGLPDTQRDLLLGLQAVWFENIKDGKKILSRVATQIIEEKKSWAYIGLAWVSIDAVRYEEADKCITKARRFALTDTFLTTFIELISLRMDIEQGKGEVYILKTLKDLLRDCGNNFLKGYIFYYLGWLGRFNANVSEREENLSRALKLFEGGNHYLYQEALVKLELSYVSSKPLDKSAQLAKEASETLKLVGKLRESNTAFDRYQQLLAEYAIPDIGEDNNSIGDCLFLGELMQGVKKLIHRYSFADREPVLILGPRGCGKDMVANALQKISSRRERPFLAINCCAIPASLLESELFGHEKGSFTGAEKLKRGFFERADGGTLFLDEIGDMSFDSQSKLLRILENKPFFRIGGETEIRTNVRVIAATNRDLKKLIAEGKFRADLLDRLRVFRITIPPLSQRREEIIPFAEKFLERYGEGEEFLLDNTARQYLLTREYEGNIRVLENIIKLGIAGARATKTNTISAALLIDDNDDVSVKCNKYEEIPRYREAKAKFDYELILAALTKTNWNKSLAAEILGLPYRTFFRMMKSHKV